MRALTPVLQKQEPPSASLLYDESMYDTIEEIDTELARLEGEERKEMIDPNTVIKRNDRDAKTLWLGERKRKLGQGEAVSET